MRDMLKYVMIIALVVIVSLPACRTKPVRDMEDPAASARQSTIVKKEPQLRLKHTNLSEQNHTIYMRVKYINDGNLHRGMNRSEVLDKIGRHSADTTMHTTEGIRFMNIVVGGHPRNYDRVPLCFKGNALVSWDQAECEAAHDEEHLPFVVEQERDYMNRFLVRVLGRETIVPSQVTLNEPFSFRGVRIGKHLADQMPYCHEEYGLPDTGNASCYVPFVILPYAHIRQLPDIMVQGDTVVRLKDNMVDELYFYSASYANEDFASDMLQLLTSRYGPPGVYDERNVGDSQGRFHRKIVAQWRIDGNLVYLTNHTHRTRRGMVMIQAEFDRKLRDQQEQFLQYMDNL